MNLSRLFRRTPAPETGNVALAVAERDEEPVVASPVYIAPSDTEFEDEYRRVAQKLNVARRPTVQYRSLAAVLAELMIPIYDLAKVKAFLDAKALGASRAEAARSIGGSARWFWYPLSAASIDQYKKELARSYQAAGLPEVAFPRQGGFVEHTAYPKEVPLPALLTAERIEDRLPGEVAFWVSDVQGFPDPFLAVSLIADPDRTLFVVERWDEPGFRG